MCEPRHIHGTLAFLFVLIFQESLVQNLASNFGSSYSLGNVSIFLLIILTYSTDVLWWPLYLSSHYLNSDNLMQNLLLRMHSLLEETEMQMIKYITRQNRTNVK